MGSVGAGSERAATRPGSSSSSRSRPWLGDCFLAGYVAARYDGASPRDCLAFGVACGAESTQHFGAGTLDRRAVERLLPSVQIAELSAPAEVA